MEGKAEGTASFPSEKNDFLKLQSLKCKSRLFLSPRVTPSGRLNCYCVLEMLTHARMQATHLPVQRTETGSRTSPAHAGPSCRRVRAGEGGSGQATQDSTPCGGSHAGSAAVTPSPAPSVPLSEGLCSADTDKMKLIHQEHGMSSGSCFAMNSPYFPAG